MLSLKSPLDGRDLGRDGPHSLTDGRTRWPVVAGIPFLRLGRDDLRSAVLAAVDAGDEESALVLLLQDQDDYAPLPPPAAERIRAALREPDLSFRAAMDALGFGPVATYFAHRWSAPTFLSGLGLLAHHWAPPSPVIEIACGVGQILLEVARHGGRAAGIDVVFAKLWLARRFVVPGDLALVCADVGHGLPLAPVVGATLLCHDAFYFLRPKATVLAEMRRVAGDHGSVLIGHAHNSGYDHGPVAGEPLTAGEYAALAPDALLYDDAALSRSVLDRTAPRAASAEELDAVEAISLAIGVPASRPVDLAAPVAGLALRLNPLLETGPNGLLHPAWPSPAFASEYADAVYLQDVPPPSADVLRRAAAGDVGDATVAALARRRVLLGLPGQW